MQRIFLLILGAAALAFPMTGHADDVAVNSGGDARLINEPSGVRNDNNGGNTITGGVIGINPGGVDNFIVHDFSVLSGVPELAGATAVGAIVTVEINEAFNPGTEGSDLDNVILNEIAIGNLPIMTGTGEITGADTQAIDGSCSFNNREEFSSASSVAWVDVDGNAVADLSGALTPLGSMAGINLPAGTPNAPLATGGEAFIYEIDAATAQRWIDDGLAGLAISVMDDGDGNSRFNLTPVVGLPGASPVTNITFNLCPDVIPGDLNGDGVVDLLDVAPFVDEILSGGDNPAADVNGDGIVDLLDVAPFVDIILGN